MFYDNFRDACARRGTNITAVIKATGHSTSLTGGWSSGSYPRLDVVIDIANYLGYTLDELVFGVDEASGRSVSSDEREWLDIISHIPADKQGICKDFLRTHMAAPEKYRKRKKSVISAEYFSYRRSHDE